MISGREGAGSTTTSALMMIIGGGVVEMLLFMLTVFVAYAYIWRRGGLSWD